MLSSARVLNISTCRFSDTFVRLIRTCAQLRSPLVLFLDDLQWSDGPSLRLLEALVKDGQSLPLLLIGAYRDVEVDESHALMRLVTCLKKGDVPLLQMHLGPLKLQDTTALVATCLGLEKRGATKGEPLGELGQLVQDKTEGNPFYSLQFLRSLVKDKLLQFDKDTGECRSVDKGFNLCLGLWISLRLGL
jgi:predicted ATPase